MMKEVINTIKYWKIEEITDDMILNIYVDSVLYDSSLIILLKSETHRISLAFNRFVSYRINDESYLLEYWDSLKNNTKNLTFSKIENSTYFKDMLFLSKDFFTDGGPDMIEHFAIFTSNECIEIISDLQPVIKVSHLPDSADL